ncbi:hypothetical protein [Bosea sp. ANAM02]|uniref:hypothetical protein n=1 Tax=Bosea sp. ANAM02 TaxID=2020412 RepID=UPI00140EB3F3|nr:hypothetical protein [Bosea sp. ANAM02]BCB22365.1 hypothetical protein OCUBac02_52590 [Bosea sp. ANAM02]
MLFAGHSTRFLPTEFAMESAVSSKLKVTFTVGQSARLDQPGVVIPLEIELPEKTGEIALRANAVVQLGKFEMPQLVERLLVDDVLFRPLPLEEAAGRSVAAAGAKAVSDFIISTLASRGTHDVVAAAKKTAVRYKDASSEEKVSADRYVAEIERIIADETLFNRNRVWGAAPPPAIVVKHPIYPAYNQGGPRMGWSELTLNDLGADPGEFAFGITRLDVAGKFLADYANIDKNEKRLSDNFVRRLEIDTINEDVILFDEQSVNVAAGVRMLLNSLKERFAIIGVDGRAPLIEIAKLREAALAGEPDGAARLLRAFRDLGRNRFNLYDEFTDKRRRFLEKSLVLAEGAFEISQPAPAPAAGRGVRP